jgi:glycosyltransferase involved in cell wall biosynthesis
MKKDIDILCFNSIKAINGPVVIHRSILKHNNFFYHRGYVVSIIFKEGIFNSEYIPNEKDKSNGHSMLKYQELTSIIKSKIIHFYQGIKFLRLLSYYFFDYKTKLKVKKYLSLGRKPEVVITDSEREMYYFLKYKKNNTKTVLFMHTDGVPLKMMSIDDPGLERTNYYKRLKRRYEYTIQHVDKIAFICNIGKINFIQSYPNYNISKLSVILNGIEEKTALNTTIKNVETNPSRHNLCCVGTLTHRKGQDIILQALSILEKQVLENIHVDIIGDGPAKKNMENFISINNLSNNINLVGSIDNLKVDEYLSKTNIFILMSRNEGLPLSIIEAMRAGLPIISTNISGIPELVQNGLNGILLDPDVKQLSNLFSQLDDYNWEAMGKSSQQLFKEKFTLSRVFSEYCDMYDSLLI